MPYSSGTFTRVHDFTDDRDNGIRIQASRMDAEMDGIATGLSTALLKDGTQTATAKIPFAVGLSVIDNQTILLGTNSDIAIQYDETTNDSLEISANVEGAALGIVLKSDQGDDNADQHKLSIADGGTLTLGSKISGSFVSYLTHTPNSTVASSTLAVAGNLTVGGNLTLGSGAELSEAELEMLDGITAGTVSPSKAVVVDANKDITSFRNVTLTGELDAGSLDILGAADIDGTLNVQGEVTFQTHLNMGDDDTIKLGDAADLQLYHDGSNSYVKDTGTGGLFIEGSAVSIRNANGTEAMASFTPDGAVSLYHDNNVVLATSSSGVTITGELVSGSLDISGNADIDGTLEADAITINGTAINSVLSPIAGSSSIVTTGALNSGSITSGFGSIDIGSSTITTTGAVGTGALTVGGAFSATAASTITTADNLAQLTLVSTDADASTGPIFKLYRNSSSPADSDRLGEIQFDGEDSAGNQLTYVQLFTNVTDVTDGTEDASLIIQTMIAGTLTNRLGISPSEVILNDQGLDLDFRVESSTTQTALFVNGADGKVGIGTNDPHQLLGIESASNPAISIVDTTNNVEGLIYADDTSFHMGALSNHNVVFRQNNAEKLRLTTNGLLGTDFFMQFPPSTPISNSSGSEVNYHQNGATTSTDGSLLNSPVPQAMTVLQMRCYVNGALSGGGARVYVAKNGSAITGTNKEIDVTTGTNAFVANAVNTDFAVGDRIGIQIILENGANAAWYHVVLLCRMTIA
jgi:hypothetical protein